MIEQQEFLDYLKNPIRTQLRRAVEEFYQAHRSSIHIAHSYEYYDNGYIVDVQSDDIEALSDMEPTLVSTIEKYLKNAFITIRTREDLRPNGLYRWTYHVSDKTKWRVTP